MGTLCLTKKKKKLKEETEDLFYVEVLQTGKIFTTNALEGMSNNFKQNFLVATSEDVAYLYLSERRQSYGDSQQKHGQLLASLTALCDFGEWRVCFVSRSLT